MPKDEIKNLNVEENSKALLFAATQNQTTMILQLLKRGVDVNIKDSKNQTPIEIIAKNKNWQVIFAFLRYPIEQAILNRMLFLAILDNQYNLVFALLMKGSHPSLLLDEKIEGLEIGDSALHLAVRKNSPEMIQLLYRFSENYFLPNQKENLSPYLLAAKLGFWNKAIHAFWAIEDFEKTRFAFISELKQDGYQRSHRQRATSLMDAALRQTKNLKELLALIEFEMDLFNPIYQRRLFRNISHGEVKQLSKYEQPPKNKKDQFNKILEKYRRIIYGKIFAEVDPDIENIDYYFRNLEGFSSIKPSAPRGS
ncbi:MAG TPA: ankyrin repeat domain-containing protein [Gammaproteobacteria bacterium]|jgi:hypothetical protein|nr:ankyrin repeat domain-containing protein [Gammaproteobacteria bacterium]